jgi:hypothetical protein
MEEHLETIQEYEILIARAFEEHERSRRFSEALVAYREIEHGLEGLEISPASDSHHERQRVLAACLDRQARILLRLGRRQEAQQVAARQLNAARAAGDLLAIAHALMCSGHIRLLSGDRRSGAHALSEARRLFESGDSPEQRLGLGEYWTLLAELMNAGTLPGGPGEAHRAADRALAALTPVHDRTALARAYKARAEANAALGEEQAAAEDLGRA